MAKLIFFTGGARSGKSAHAEQYAASLGRPVVYVATAEAGDAEMRARISHHRAQRPAHWHTLEAPMHVAAALRGLPTGSVVLLDCLSLLVSNLLLAHEDDAEPAVTQELHALLDAARACDLTLIVVSNEVGMGIVPEYPLGRVYRDLLGRANQRVAAAADAVYLLVCGVALELKALATPASAALSPAPSAPRVPAHGALDHAELAALGVRPAQVLDFSSNLNPFGPPTAVRAALAALDPAPYPDRSCQRLRKALSTRHHCDPAAVLVGNGANELIHLLARALLQPGDAVLVIAPTYGEYAHASRLAGAQVHEWRADAADDFAFEGEAIRRMLARLRPRLTWLCAPNNPTGSDLAPAAIRDLAAVCAAHGGYLVVDRAYHAFRRDGDPHRDPLDEDAPAGLLRLHALTKSYALAGLRLGYLLAQPELLARLGAYQPTWSVNSAAQAAGLAALNDLDFLRDSLPRLWAASDSLHAALGALGLHVWHGALPFMLVRSGDGAATRTALLRQGYMVRDCASFGLPTWVRVAPRREAENARLVAAWQRLLMNS